MRPHSSPSEGGAFPPLTIDSGGHSLGLSSGGGMINRKVPLHLRLYRTHRWSPREWHAVMVTHYVLFP
jgi:hypothetical protein